MRTGANTDYNRVCESIPVFPIWVIRFPYFHFGEQRCLPKTHVMRTLRALQVHDKKYVTEFAIAQFTAFPHPSTLRARELLFSVREIMDLHKYRIV